MRTMADLVDRLRAYLGNDGSEQKSSAVLRAAAESVQAISHKHQWASYKTWGRITTDASQTTGTIAVDVTGGAYERMVTLTGATWPTWAAGYGTIVIDNIPYDVQTRVSSTIVTLKANSCPTSDVAAGTSYTIYRARYDLPTDFVAIWKPIVTNENRTICKITLEEFITRRNCNDTVGTPIVFALVDSGYGRTQILLWNPPDAVYPLEFEYQRKPVLPVVVEESSGLVSLTSGSTAVTGLNTAFRAAMSNAVLRISYDGTKPTGYDGVHPPEYEYLLDGYTSSTALTLAEAASASVTRRAFTISSRVDVMDGPMFEYLTHIGYMKLRMALRINMTSEEPKQYEMAKNAAKDADGQLYAGTDVAASPASLGYGAGGRKLSYMRNG